MVPTAKEILFSRAFPRQNNKILGQSIPDLKVIIEYVYGTASFSAILAV